MLSSRTLSIFTGWPQRYFIIWKRVTIKLIQVTVREAKLPNLDGLYGGKACVREDGLELTKYEDSDVDKKYFGVEDEKIVLGACDVQLCPPIIDEVSQQGSTEKNCISMWTEWSPFGKCDKDCGDYGNRKRTRWICFSGRRHTEKCIRPGISQSCLCMCGGGGESNRLLPECFVPNDKTKCVKIYLCSENVSAPVMRRRKRMIVDRHSKASPIPPSEKRWDRKDICK